MNVFANCKGQAILSQSDAIIFPIPHALPEYCHYSPLKQRQDLVINLLIEALKVPLCDFED